MTERTPPRVLELTPLNPAFRDDPYAMLADLAANHPVMRDDLAGVFLVSRHDDVRGILTDLTLWRDPHKAEAEAVLTRRILDQGVEEAPEREGVGSILLLDDPDHARIRAPLAQALYKRVARCRPQVEEVVAQTLDALEGREGFDLMAEVSLPIPIDVIARILGVDTSRYVEFRDWSEGLIQSLNPLRTPAQTEHMIRASEALGGFMAGMLAMRRAKGEDDLVTDMVELQAAGADLPDADLITNLISLLVGREPDHHRPDRQRRAPVPAQPGRTRQAQGRPHPDRRGCGGGPALRAAGGHHRAHRLARHGGARLPGARHPVDAALPARRQPRPGGVRGS